MGKVITQNNQPTAILIVVIIVHRTQTMEGQLSITKFSPDTFCCELLKVCKSQAQRIEVL